MPKRGIDKRSEPQEPRSSRKTHLYALLLVAVAFSTVGALLALCGVFTNKEFNPSADFVEKYGEIAGQGEDRFIVFFGPSRGQGIGNMMFGLLRAHILARRFGRRVCVEWEDFEVAWDYDDEGCADLKPKISLHVWNFGRRNSDEEVEMLLKSPLKSVYMTGNELQDNVRLTGLTWFFDFYSPKPALEALFPEVWPPFVAHIRRGDGGRDIRGVFEYPYDPFPALRRCLKGYVVLSDTTTVYKGLGDSVLSPKKAIPHTIDSKLTDAQKVQTWFEWTLIAKAKKVLRTHSGFSESAIRVSDAQSFQFDNMITIGAVDDPHLGPPADRSFVVLSRERWYTKDRRKSDKHKADFLCLSDLPEIGQKEEMEERVSDSEEEDEEEEEVPLGVRERRKVRKSPLESLTNSEGGVGTGAGKGGQGKGDGKGEEEGGGQEEGEEKGGGRKGSPSEPGPETVDGILKRLQRERFQWSPSSSSTASASVSVSHSSSGAVAISSVGKETTESGSRHWQYSARASEEESEEEEEEEGEPDYFNLENRKDLKDFQIKDTWFSRAFGTSIL
uniref:Uncharacterized protein n=1 Tax=Chromera velia CCMP2878 TaxID=1169474 RepID=A0A0G4HVX5_9ALVE|eukprot:Cvel_32447.t1-p1 / transcript=Cvel_32447.t1 / gene=Cvel_32447 / organism=Chromera_velia_CCMP2878 / gene_product=hypothetical protein / transcript_product=hypothetical protein / location=Cvel_scaffold5051:3546-6030(-) / protein_length=557 / sequence_SO=supercontig / SO=protein_coding / is_pseudo=false